MSISECVSFDPANRHFRKAGRERIFAEQQEVRAGGAFDPSPNIVASIKARRGFDEIAVGNLIVGGRARVTPNKSARHVAVCKRTVVHQRGGHALLVLRGEKPFRTSEAAVRILSAPIVSGLNGQPEGPGIQRPLVNTPTIFAGLAP